MITEAMLVSIGAAGVGVAQVPLGGATPFAQSVRAYVEFTTPHCAAEEIGPYRAYASSRDTAFRQSLRHTPLEEAYRSAVREEEASERSTVYECFGPPPPPPPPGTVARQVDPRTLAITEAQRRLRSSADNQPGVFDRGDNLFAAMIAARDEMLSGRP